MTQKPPQAVLAEMINGYWVTFSIAAAAELGVADHLAAGPTSVNQLAERTGTHAPSLYRLLRALASLSIFAEDEQGRFANTPLSEALRAGVPGSMRGLARLTLHAHLKAWPDVLHSVRTGHTAFEKVFGAELFEHLQKDQELAAIFDEAFTGYTAALSEAAAATYDFSRFRHIVDVGGSAGALVAAILKRVPEAKGINFDLPHVAERAKAALAKTGLGERVSSVGGDFFQSVPAGGDAYTLKMILHDWDDQKSIDILKNVRKAIAADGRLLVIEAVIPAGNAPSPGKLLDVNMLVMTGGFERTEEQYRALYRAAGFELTRITPINPASSVIEGRPA